MKHSGSVHVHDCTPNAKPSYISFHVLIQAPKYYKHRIQLASSNCYHLVRARESVRKRMSPSSQRVGEMLVVGA